MTHFDRYGKCPICKKSFKSQKCPHSYGYVSSVLKMSEMKKDLKKIERKNSK